jgi:hypothetical protein
MTGMLKKRLECQLHERVEAGYDNGAMQMVLAFGRPYRGIVRPKEFRHRPPKACFRNAARLAFDGRGDYVEGFAISRLGSGPIHHAWITVNGHDAIDVTWGNPESCAYFGIVVKRSYLAEWLSQTVHWGVLDPLHPKLAERFLGVSRRKLVELLTIRGRGDEPGSGVSGGAKPPSTLVAPVIENDGNL